MNTLQDYVKIGWRRAGSPELKKATEYTAERLRSFGISDVQIQPFPFIAWHPEAFRLTVLAGDSPSLPQDQELPCFPIWHTSSTTEKGIEGELIYLENGTMADFQTKAKEVRGKIVVVDSKIIMNFSPAFRTFGTYELAMKFGASGMIAVNDSPLDTLSAFFAPRKAEAEKAKIPGVSVNKFDGEYLKTLALSGKGKVKLFLQTKFMNSESWNVFARLPGRTDEAIVIGTHLDSWFSGAVDNAAANAGLLALARYYASLPQVMREKTLFFVGMGGHEVNIGPAEFLKANKALVPNMVTFIMLDGLGSSGYYNEIGGGAIATGRDEKRGIFVSENPLLFSLALEKVHKYKLLPAAYVSAFKLPVSDLPPFLQAKIPSLMIIGKPVWYHTQLDTPDKCTPNQLERSIRAHQEIIDTLDKIPGSVIRENEGQLKTMDGFIVPKSGMKSPSFQINAIPNPTAVKNPIVFYVTSFDDPESVILKIEWDFGDGTPGAEGPLTHHAYEKPGLYRMKVTIMNAHGGQAKCTKLLRIFQPF